MKRTSSEKYLGDIISNNGKIDENIEDRVNKGRGRINSIISLLEEISFGENYFEMALLFRNSMLINSLLSSSEVLYNVEKKHIDKLERCDKDLFARVLGVPSTCSSEAFYLETGVLPIKFILQGRRLMYYRDLLRKSESELVKKFFDTQKKFTSKNDWIIQVQNDLKDLNIDKTEEEIIKMTKYSYKKLIKNKLKINATHSLFYDKSEEKRSKIKNLTSFKLQNYLRTNKFTTKQKKLLFSLRTRSIDVKNNYKNKFQFNMKCRMCEDENSIDSEEHYLKCSKILENFDDNEDILNAKYEDIFSQNIDEQISITRIFETIFKIRQKILNIKY